MTRVDVLRQLLDVSVPVSEAVARLVPLRWDAESDLVELREEHCSNVITLFIRGAISQQEVEIWANALECREDVAISTPLVGEVIHELANPTLTHPLTSSRGELLLARMRHAG
jgi:hypothetical protein